MTRRVHNFNPGPAALPLPVLEQVQSDLLDFAGTGMSILETSHRSATYEQLHNRAIADLRALLGGLFVCHFSHVSFPPALSARSRAGARAGWS